MITVVRGADVGFASTFKDETGATYTPPSATLKVTYYDNNVATTSTVSMQNYSGTWRATWNSASADIGQVDWFIKSGGAVSSVNQGSFMLVSNTANPEV